MDRPKTVTELSKAEHGIPRVKLKEIKHVGFERSIESSSINSPALTADQIADLADLI